MFFYRIASANEALVITGAKSQQNAFRILTGKGAFVSPIRSRTMRLSLDLRESQLKEPCVTQQGIQLVVEAIAVFKVGDDNESISNAARRFADQQSQMQTLVGQILAGHLRSIVGELTVEDIIRDRNKLAQQVKDSSSDEMAKMGLIIDSFQIREIGDPSNYIAQLAAPHIAEAQKNARVAAAQANQAATEQEQISAAKMAGFNRDSAIAASQANGQAEAAKEQAAQQGPLAAAQAAQAVAEQNALLAQKNAEVREAQLDAEVRKPADAARYKTVTDAQAEADAQSAKASSAAAQATQITTIANAEAAAIKAKNDALGDGNLERQVSTDLVKLMPEIVKAAASGLQGANLTILNGSEGLGQVLTGLLGEGKVIYDALVNQVRGTGADAEKPAVNA